MPLYRAALQRRLGILPPVLIHNLSQVLYLPFDKDDGSYARDRSGYNNHGTIYGATRVVGKVGGALSFNGTSDYVQGSMTALDLPGPLTLMAHIRPAVVNSSQIIMQNSQNTSQKGFYLAVTNLGRVRFAGGNGSTLFDILSDSALVVATWYYVAGVYDKVNAVMYVDGVKQVEVDAATADISQFATGGFRIGKFDGAVWYWKGLIDEVRVFNRALSAAEIIRVMNMRGI